MKKLIPLIAAGLLASSCSSNSSDAQANAPFNKFGDRALSKYRTDSAVRNVILVQCVEGSDALVQVYHKDDSLGTWSRVIDADACIGRNGWTDAKREGDGKSPVGDFGILLSFGIKPDPGCAISYLQVVPDTYAIDDPADEYYNLIVDASEAGTRSGEEMHAYSPEYNYGLSLDYNKERERGAGSNIFFHCKGAKPATGGCVAVDESVMLQILQMIAPSDRVCIYPLREPSEK